MYKSISITTSLFLFAVIVSVTACSSDKKQANQDADQTKPVMITLSTPSGNSDKSITASGQVEASQTVNISTRVMGNITQLSVKVGDAVSKGQLIATISNEDILSKRAQVDAQIKEAEATLQNAQKDLDRFTVLYQQKSATAKELDNVTLQYHAVQSRLEAARQMRNEINASLAYTHLTAPFAGIVTQKIMDAGSMASPGMPIVTIEQRGSLQIAATISESDIASIQLHDAVQVAIKSLNKSFHAFIIQISPSSQFTGGQYIVKINIPESEKSALYAGMYVNINIPSKVVAKKTDTTAAAVMVPVSSIVYRDQLTGIYTVSNDHKALLRWVRLGKVSGQQAEVLSGLNASEAYISGAKGKLYNGVLVQERK